MGLGIAVSAGAAVASFLFCWSFARTSCLDVAVEEVDDWERPEESVLRRAPLPPDTAVAVDGSCVLMELSSTVESAAARPRSRAPLPAVEKL